MARVETRADQILLLLLEGFGVIQRRAQADKYRTGVGRQPAREMLAEFGEIEAVIGDDRGHSGAAIGALDHDAIGRGIDNTRAIQNRLVHLGGGDILAFPAEGVAEAVDEMEKASFIAHHQVAGAKPGIALGEYIAQDLLLGLGGIGVALEAAAGTLGRSDPPDRLADFAFAASDTETAGATDGHAALGIDANDRGRKAMRQQRWNPADRTRLSLDIVEREVALGRRVKLQDLWNRKPRLKGLPDIAAQTIAAGETQPMRIFEFRHRRFKKIAAEFADILKKGAVPAHDVAPEGADGEFLRQHHRRSRRQHAARRDHAADTVEQRQAIEQPILRGRIRQSGKPTTPIQNAPVTDAGGLRQARRSRG